MRTAINIRGKLRVAVLGLLALSAGHPVAAQTAPPQDDVVIEVVDLDAAQESTPSQNRSTQSKLALSGRIVGRGDMLLRGPPELPSGTDLPYERGRGTTYAYLRASSAPRPWFEASVSGVLEYQLTGYQDIGPRSRSRLTADLRDLYFGLYAKHVEPRVGQQRIAWGLADSISPNDVVNARDRRNPFLLDEDLLSIPTPTVRLDLFTRAASLQLVAGAFVPDRYDLYGTPWALLQPRAPTTLRGVAHVANASVDSSLRPELNRLLAQTERPLLDRQGLTAGARIAWRLGPVDVQHYYHFGYDSTPYFRLSPAAEQNFSLVDWQNPPTEQVLLGVFGPDKQVRADFVRRHHLGTDVAVMFGSWALRLDAAYDTKRGDVPPRPASFQAPALRGVLGFEYQTGSIDKVLLIELLAQHLLDASPTPLLGYNQTTFGAAAMLRWPLGWRLHAELRSLLSVAPSAMSARPELYYERDDFRLGLGALLLAGAPRSFGWYYERSSEVYLRASWTF